jgi:hypothetical protein
MGEDWVRPPARALRALIPEAPREAAGRVGAGAPARPAGGASFSAAGWTELRTLSGVAGRGRRSAVNRVDVGSSPTPGAVAEWPSSRRRPPAKRSGNCPARVRIPSRRPRGCSSMGERCVADALMPVRSRSSTPICWPAGEVLVVAHLASTQDERVRFPPPALDGTVAQQEEHRPETPEVISSTLVGPTPPASTRSSPAEHRSDTPEAPGAAPGASTRRLCLAPPQPNPPRASRSRRSPDTRETPGSIPGRRTQRRYEVTVNRAGFYPVDLRSSRSAGTAGGQSLRGQRRVAHQESASPTPRRQPGRHRPRRPW